MSPRSPVSAIGSPESVPGRCSVSPAAAERDTLHRAYCLHARDYSDTSLLVELFVEGAGRCAAVAKGARRRRNPAGALLQPFQPLWVGIMGRGEVQTLTRVEAAGRPLVPSGRALVCGFYVNELLVRLLGRRDPHEALFAYYHGALVGLLEGEEGLESVLRRFELHLLAELGHAPDLTTDAASGEPVMPERAYRVDPGLGPLYQAGEGSGPLVSGATLLALARGDALAAEQQREARPLLRCLLDPHLGPRPLKSRELFRRWRSGTGR